MESKLNFAPAGESGGPSFGSSQEHCHVEEMISIRHLCVIVVDLYRNPFECDVKDGETEALTNCHVGYQGTMCCLGVQEPGLYVERPTQPTERYNRQSQSFHFQSRPC